MAWFGKTWILESHCLSNVKCCLGANTASRSDRRSCRVAEAAKASLCRRPTSSRLASGSRGLAKKRRSNCDWNMQTGKNIQASGIHCICSMHSVSVPASRNLIPFQCRVTVTWRYGRLRNYMLAVSFQFQSVPSPIDATLS